MPANEEVVLDVPSTEEIAQHYSAMGDSVDLINAGQPADMDDADWFSFYAVIVIELIVLPISYTSYVGLGFK